MGKRIGLGCLGLGLVSLGQAVQAQWAQVENVYQRRADLVPNLVETVKGAAAFEKDTFTAVTEARSKVGQVNAAGIANDPQAFAKFQQAQDGLSSARSRLMVVVEKYPDLTAAVSDRFRKGDFTGGLVHGVAEAGRVLELHFPRDDAKPNELADDVDFGEKG